MRATPETAQTVCPDRPPHSAAPRGPVSCIQALLGRGLLLGTTNPRLTTAPYPHFTGHRKLTAVIEMMIIMNQRLTPFYLGKNDGRVVLVFSQSKMADRGPNCLPSPEIPSLLLTLPDLCSEAQLYKHSPLPCYWANPPQDPSHQEAVTL